MGTNHRSGLPELGHPELGPPFLGLPELGLRSPELGLPRIYLHPSSGLPRFGQRTLLAKRGRCRTGVCIVAGGGWLRAPHRAGVHTIRLLPGGEHGVAEGGPMSRRSMALLQPGRCCAVRPGRCDPAGAETVAGAPSASVVNVGLGRQRRRLSLYIKKAPLCGNGRGLRTHQSWEIHKNIGLGFNWLRALRDEEV